MRVRIVEIDDDYLGVEIRAWTDRFSGTAFVYASSGQLSELAERVGGYPPGVRDPDPYEFGTRNPGYAGGYCKIYVRTVDKLGHAALRVSIDDDSTRFSDGSAEFTIPVEAAAVDRFVEQLRTLERDRSGEALLAPSV